MENKLENSSFEDDSTIHFGGDGEQGFDLLQGFDEASPEPTPEPTAAPAVEQTTAPEEQETGDTTTPTSERSEAPAEANQPEGPGNTDTLTFRARIDHQDREVSVGREELPTLYQKAQNMDRAVQREQEARQETERYQARLDRIASVAKALHYEGDSQEAVIESLLSGVTQSARDSRVSQLTEEGVNPSVAEFMADSQVVGAVREAENANGSKVPAESPAVQDSQTPSEAPGPAERPTPTPQQFSADLELLLARRPELRNAGQPFPEEVLRSYMRGENLTVAYLDYESRKTAAEKEELEKQNRVFKQNQSSAQRAPVRGSAGGGNTAGQEDPWLAGFDDNYY